MCGSGGGACGDSLCKGGSCNTCRSAIIKLMVVEMVMVLVVVDVLVVVSVVEMVLVCYGGGGDGGGCDGRVLVVA